MISASGRHRLIHARNDHERKMSFVRTVYTGLMRRTSTFVLSIVVAAVFFERAFDVGGNAIFDRINAGVSKIAKVLH